MLCLFTVLNYWLFSKTSIALVAAHLRRVIHNRLSLWKLDYNEKSEVTSKTTWPFDSPNPLRPYNAIPLKSLQGTHLSLSLIHEQVLHLPNFTQREMLLLYFGYEKLIGLFLCRHTACHNPVKLVDWFWQKAPFRLIAIKFQAWLWAQRVFHYDCWSYFKHHFLHSKELFPTKICLKTALSELIIDHLFSAKTLFHLLSLHPDQTFPKDSPQNKRWWKFCKNQQVYDGSDMIIGDEHFIPQSDTQCSWMWSRQELS